ncbi:MAG: ankyrin repeat domain-containing protein [Bacteroidota bacterium]
MKKIIVFVFLFIGLPTIYAQYGDNLFIGRDFWKSAPDVETVKLKIEEGHDPVAMNQYAFDATVYALLENAPAESIKYLLSLKGNEVDKITHDGRNYLMWAAYKGNIPIMQWLIDQGSDIHLVDDHGYNMMTFAAVGGQQSSEVYDLLLANGCNIDDTNREGANALLLLAPHLKDAEMLNYFVGKGLDLKTTDNEGNNLINYSARLGNSDMIDHFIKKGLAYKRHNDNGGNAVMFASRGWRRSTNERSFFEYLDRLGVEMDVVTYEGKTPLHSISFNHKDVSLVDFFADRCVNVNQKDKDGNTALFNAIRGRNNDMISKLLSLTDDIDYQNHAGMSALLFAARSNEMSVMKMILDNNPDINVKDAQSRNAITHLFDVYSDRKRQLFDDQMEYFLGQGLEPTVNKMDGTNILHLAVNKRSIYLIDRAVQLGADINRRNRDGLTPLHLAAMTSTDEQMLRKLLEYGADPGIKTEFDERAYDLAMENELLKMSEDEISFLKD